MRHSAPICYHCQRPIRDGEARWSARDPGETWHYICATKAGLTLAANRPASLDTAISVLGPRQKHGAW